MTTTPPSSNLAPTTKKPTFEAALEALQSTVKKLESGELSLEQALKNFEEGVRLSRVCQEHLTTAEHRVDILMKGATEGADGKVETQPFTPGRG
jgi:exodeoxyribonuclease VII small subunit